MLIIGLPILLFDIYYHPPFINQIKEKDEH
jgi:hypothetical protein